MSYYTTITLSEYSFNNLIDALEEVTTTKEDFYDIAELVHLIDLLNEEYDEDAARQNKAMQNSLRYQEFKNSSEYMSSTLFWKIHDILDEYKIESDYPEHKFYITCKIIDLFNEKNSDDTE